MDISVENVSQIVQKVRQAHWRVQRQWIGLFLLGLVVVSMVAGLYLNITVRATLAGREIQTLQSDLINNGRKNSDLEMQLAKLNSVESMQTRAEALGFQPASPEDITYIAVPGYTPAKAVEISPTETASPNPTQNFSFQPEYTESLFDWIARVLASSASSGGQP
jgi:cell division protein FtsL